MGSEKLGKQRRGNLPEILQNEDEILDCLIDDKLIRRGSLLEVCDAGLLLCIEVHHLVVAV